MAKDNPTSEKHAFQRQRTFRGAKIREVPERQQMGLAATHTQVEHKSLIGYEVAREGAKRKKNWAKRWFREHKPGSFYP